MQDYTGWLSALLDMLRMGDEQDSLVVIRCAGGSAAARVELIEEELSIEEALTYAYILQELGEELRAGELFKAIVAAAFHNPTFGDSGAMPPMGGLEPAVA